MSFHLRYAGWVRLQFSAILLAALVLVPTLAAQINGPRASVTSLGGPFTLFNPPGVRASVTSLGPLGFTPFSNPPTCCFPNRSFIDFRHHHRPAALLFAVPYPVYMPYYSQEDTTDADESAEAETTTSPTIFDRRRAREADASLDRVGQRLSRLEQVLDEAESAHRPADSTAAPAAASESADQTPTVLVFRDGHMLEVNNYAIVGNTLYQFSSERRRKIPLAELDLAATEKQNEDRGIDFQVPKLSPGN